jgi:predicted GNAT family N-acyltransferase
LLLKADVPEIHAGCKLMETMLEWCASHEIDQVTLAASDEGRPLYRALGFKPATDMKLVR